MLGFATAIFSFVGVLAAQSKGVWLALSITVAFIGLFGFCQLKGKRRLGFLCALASLALIVSATAFPYVDRIAGKTFTALSNLVELTYSSGGISNAIKVGIESKETPPSTTERLKLVFNAIELFNKSPLMGFGNLWIAEWKNRTYNDLNFTLLHNGYLEVLVRHGVMGILILAIFSIEAARRFIKAHRNGEISLSALGFILTI